MKQSRIFITVLFSLFMFQSLWNVAAAFCTHESSYTLQNTEHFGHHISSNIHKEPSKPSSLSKDLAQSQQQLNDDHSDHLPSLAHFLLLDFHSEMMQHKSSFYKLKAYFDWRNFYQSPYLSFLNPPPNSAPLSVG